MIERNLAAQLKILDALRMAYARAAPERRVYSNAIQRRRIMVESLLQAYDNYMSTNGTLLDESPDSLVSLTTELLPDEVLTERCAKGLEFYQRMVTNVSKLLQRVKGMFNVIIHYYSFLTGIQRLI